MKLTDEELLSVLSGGGVATSDRRDQLEQWVCVNLESGEMLICDEYGIITNAGLDFYDLQDETWRPL